MNLGRVGWLLLVAAGLLVGIPEEARAQKGADKIHFTTVDGVEIQGAFYNSNKRAAPVVILLHAIGEDSRKKGWVALAEELQAQGFCVLTFDFRGHGASNEIDSSMFWSNPVNRTLVKNDSKVKGNISWKSFHRSYYPVLVNDIAAAKAFLDRSKNDTGICNTSSTILIGGETGATLGAIWLNSEWYRYKMNPPMMFGMPPIPDSRPEGKDVVGAIWLSISPKLGDRSIRLTSVLDTPGRVGATPMVFMYSDGDPTGKTVAKQCEQKIKLNLAKDPKFQFTTAFQIKGNTKLTGSQLLQKSLGTENAIVDYLKDVLQAKGNEWVERDFRKTTFIWRSPMNFNSFVPAKPPTEMNLKFDNYEKFIP